MYVALGACAGVLKKAKILPLGCKFVKGLNENKVYKLLGRHRDGETVTKIHVHP